MEDFRIGQRGMKLSDTMTTVVLRPSAAPIWILHTSGSVYLLHVLSIVFQIYVPYTSFSLTLTSNLHSQEPTKYQNNMYVQKIK